jgi:hypothetical protein
MLRPSNTPVADVREQLSPELSLNFAIERERRGGKR